MTTAINLSTWRAGARRAHAALCRTPWPLQLGGAVAATVGLLQLCLGPASAGAQAAGVPALIPVATAVTDSSVPDAAAVLRMAPDNTTEAPPTF